MYLVFQCKREAQGQTIGSRTNKSLESTRLSHPLATSLGVETQGTTIDGQTNLTRFAWLEIHFLESLELLVRTIDGGLDIVDVELDGFSTCHLTRIGNGEGEGNLIILCHLLLISRELAQREGGITQPMTKGEQWL